MCILWADSTLGRDILLSSRVPSPTALCYIPLVSQLFIPETILPLPTRRMQRLKDPDHLDFHSTVTYPVGPDASGEITYLHVPPLSALTSTCNQSPCFYLTSHLTCALLASNHHSVGLHSSRCIHLVLPLSPDCEVPERPCQGRQGPHRQTTAPGIRAIAVRPALEGDDDAAAGATTDASDARALRTAGHAHRAAAAGSKSLARVVARALIFFVVFIFALVFVLLALVFVLFILVFIVLALILALVLADIHGDAAEGRAALWRTGGHRHPGGRGHLGTEHRGDSHHAQEGRWPLRRPQSRRRMRALDIGVCLATMEGRWDQYSSL